MKRVASETLTKEHGSTPNADSTEHSGDSVSKMANAAQMARRKLATPKSRLNRSTTPTGGASSTNPAPNAFASAGFGSQQSQSFQPPSNMFSFGSNNSVSSSFPPSTSQPFSFSAPGSQSFTFGQSSSTPNNPFANLNGEAGGGAGNDNTMMDTSPQKAPPTFSFGANSSSTPSNGPLFGGQQSQSQQPTPAFAGSLFGQQPKPEDSKPSSNPFGQTSEPKQNGLGPSTANVFGQSNVSSTSSGTLFGSLDSSTQSTSTPASSQPSVFKFGETTSKAPTDSTTSVQPPAFGDAFKSSQPLFGGASSSQGQSNSLSTSGPEASSSTSESQPVSKPIFSFGTPAPAFGSKPEEPKFGFGTSTSNIFGQAPKSSDKSPATVQSNIFGQSSTKPATDSKSPEPEQTTGNPFAGLFGGSPSETTTNTTSTVLDKPKPSFTFGQGTSFGSPAKVTESSTKPATETTAKPAFAFGTPSASSNTPLFSAQSNANAPNALFNLNKPTPSAETTVEPPNHEALKAQEELTPKQQGSTGAKLFGKTLPAFGTPAQDTEPKAASTLPPNPFSSLAKPSTPSSARESFKPASTETPTNQASSKLFGAPPSSAPPKSASNIFNSAPKVQPTTLAASSSSNQPEPSNETVQRSISTEGPPQIPRYLNAKKYKSYDENWRLKSLNRQFKDAILQLDPDRHDFMNIIQNYMDHREGIGEGLAFYERQKAGMKRKAGDVDEMHNDDASTKRARPAVFPANAQPSTASKSASATASTSNLFSSLSSSQPSSTAKPVADPKTAELFRSMIPGAKPNAAERSTTPPSSPPKQPAPQMPKFEAPKFGGGPTNFMDAFAKQSASSAKKFQDEAKEKRKAEEFDSDEDDEEAWNKKYEEEQLAKKAKIAGVSQGGFSPSISNAGSRASSPFNFNAPVPANSTGSSNNVPQSFLGLSTQSGNTSGTPSEKPVEGDDDEVEGSEETTGDDEGSEYEPENGEAEEDDLPEDDVDQDEEEEDDEGSEVPDLPAGQSLFGRITRDGTKAGGVLAKPNIDSPIVQPAPNSSYKSSLMFSNIGSSTPDAPGFSPLTPASDSQKVGSSFIPTTKFEFTSTPAYASASSTPVPGASVFSGGLLKDGPIPGEGLFGSRPSTPLNGENARGNIFGFSNSTSVPNDKTWKPGSAIKFGSPDRDAPSVEITEATPPAKSTINPFGGLFGNVSGKASLAPNNGPSLGFNFGNPPNATGLLAPHLGSGNSGISSGISSRATSPGATDNESVATDNTEDYSNEPQTSLISSGAGEEGERVLFESRAQVQRLFKSEEVAGTKYTVGWNKMGLGNLRVLKNDESGKARILMRAEPSANILLNANLIAGVDYKASAVGKSGGAVTFGASVEGKFGTWMLQVKTKAVAEELSKILQDNKA